MKQELEKEKKLCEGEYCRRKAVVTLEGGLFSNVRRNLCREHFVEWSKEHPTFAVIKVKPI
jgi:hypothetical protein